LRDTKRSWLLFALVFCSPVFMIWLADFWWFFELFTHFRAQYIFTLGFAALVLHLMKQHIWAVWVDVLWFWNILWILPLYFPAKEPKQSSSKTLHVIMANVQRSNAQHKTFVGYIKKQNPDSFFAIEVDESWIKSLQALHSTYPYRRLDPQPNNFGIGFYSKWPIREQHQVEVSSWGKTSLHVKVNVNRQHLHLVGTHPMPPVGSAAAMERNQHLQNAAQYVSTLHGPKILLGDFNCTSWSPTFDRVLRISSLQDSRQGWGLQPSWLRNTGVFTIPIDHMLISKNIQVLRREIGPDIHSDHRPVSMHFSLPLKNQKRTKEER